MKLLFSVTHQNLKRLDKCEVVGDSKNYLKAQFQFLTDEWVGTKTALFKKGDLVKKQILDENGECDVPWEVIKSSCFTVSVFAGDLIPTDEVTVRVKQSGYAEGSMSLDPTPDVYTQIMKKLDSLQAGSVDKDAVKAAVEEYMTANPVDGSVSDEQVAALIADYFNENPIAVTGGASVSRWANKTLCAFGTSVTYRCSNGGGYLKVLQDTLGLASYTNNGLDGNAIAYVSGREGISRKVQNTDITGFDIITIEGCTNDFKLNVPIGEVGAMGDTDLDESVNFCQALRKAIESILTANPQANILLIADTQRDNADYDVNYENSAGHRLIDYVDAMISIGELYGIPVCDLYRKSGINQLTLGTYTSDGLHPNSLGYIRIGNVIASAIQNMYSNEVVTYTSSDDSNTDNESSGDSTEDTGSEDSGSTDAGDNDVTTEGNTITISGVSYDISGASDYAYKMIMKLGSNYYLYASNKPFYVYDESTYNETFYADDTVRGTATSSATAFSGFASIASHGTDLGDGYHYMSASARTLSAYVWTNVDICYYGTDTVAVSA